MTLEERGKLISPITRVVVGFILVYSGFIKLVEPFDVFYNAILGYKVVGEKIAYLSALILPWFELYLGLFLILGLFERYVISICILLFLFFEILLLQAIVRRLDVVNCGCFGTKHSNPIELEFVLNLIWLFFLYVSFRFKSNLSLDAFIDKRFRE